MDNTASTAFKVYSGTLNADTFGTRSKCPVYRGVHISGVPRNVDTWGIGQNVQYIGVSSR